MRLIAKASSPCCIAAKTPSKAFVVLPMAETMMKSSFSPVTISRRLRTPSAFLTEAPPNLYTFIEFCSLNFHENFDTKLA